MGENDLSLNSSAALISAAVLFPIVAVIVGCAYCCRQRRSSESNTASAGEREPLISGQEGEPQSRTERVEHEGRYSSPSNTAFTTAQIERIIEETRQQEAQSVVVTEAALIPDLLKTEGKEQEKSHQTEPDILEPRPVTDITHFPQYEQRESSLVNDGAQQDLPPPQLAENQLLPNLEDVKEQIITPDRENEQFKERAEVNVAAQGPTLHIEPDKEPGTVFERKLENSTPDKELQNEIPQDIQEPLLPEPRADTVSAESQDPQKDTQGTVSQTDQLDSEDVLSRTPPKIETTSEPNKEQPKKEGEKTEEETMQSQEEPSTSAQLQEDKETSDEAVTEAGETVKENLEQATEPTSKVEINLALSPSFVKTMRTKAAKKDSKAIFGLTVLNQQLFIISEHSQDVEVYDSTSLAFKHQFHLEELYDPIDIKSCTKNNCLYIFDWKNEPNSGEILRFGSDGRLITRWETKEDGGYISVTQEANVILSSWKKSLLKEFTADGQFIREIQLPATITELRLAIKLSNGNFVISHGEDEVSEHRVCLVDDQGAVIKWIGGKQGSSNGEFYSPNYMVVDGAGFILVADQNNRRVVLLGPDLEFKRELIQERDDLRYPVRMELDQTSGRLFIADNDYLENHKGWRDGRVTAFDFMIRH